MTNNTAGGAGGGVFVDDPVQNRYLITILDSTISGNTAAGNGGGLSHDGGLAGVATVIRSTISGNSAAKGGGIDIVTGSLVLTHSTISNNAASDQGGGLFNSSAGELEVSNSTITANTAANGGGGLATSGGAATLRSTILAGNIGGDVLGTLTSDSRTNLISGDPLLGPLADNGGLTLTHALLTGSPARGTGSNPLSLTTDQRGGSFARTVGGSSDIGSFQDQTPLSTGVATVAVFGGNGLNITLAHETKAQRSKGTGFGPVQLDAQTKQITYRIFNDGDAMLVIAAIEPRGQRPGDYSIISAPSLNIAPGESSSFTVSFDPVAYGTRRANIAIFSNDAGNGGRFTLRIAGRGIPDPDLQDIDVTGGTASISDNDRKARNNTGQKFGTASVGGQVITVYTITNVGNTTLTLQQVSVVIAGANPGDFRIVTSPPVAAIGPGGTTTFSIAFSPTALGARHATLQLFTDDPDEETFDFKVIGTGT